MDAHINFNLINIKKTLHSKKCTLFFALALAKVVNTGFSFAQCVLANYTEYFYHA